MVGIVGGFLLLVVPGIVSIRSYRRWRRGEIRRPTFAWVTGGIFVAYLIVVVLGVVALYRRPLFQDDFSDATSGWDTRGYLDGGYEVPFVAGGAQDYRGLIWSEGTFPNVAVEVDIQFLEGTNDAMAGVGCANSSSNAGYVFALEADGGYLIQRLDAAKFGEDFELLQVGRTDARPTTDTVRIRGECRAGFGEHELRMLVNGRLVATVVVDPRVRDFDAVILATGSPDATSVHARFDNLIAIAIQPSA